jgi:hypothetical protein
MTDFLKGLIGAIAAMLERGYHENPQACQFGGGL